jgi:hypothetical protein
MTLDITKKVFILCIIVTAFLLLFRLDAYLMDYDEGDLYLYPSMLVNTFGMHPYKDFTYTQPPLLLYAITDVYSGRLISVFSAFILIGCVFLIGKKFGAGYYAAIFAAACPLIIIYGRLAVGDIPMLAMLSVALYIIIYEHKSNLGMFDLGVVIFLAFMMKIQVIIPFGVLFFYLLVIRKEISYVKALAVFMILFVAAEYMFPGMISETIFNNKPNIDLYRSAVYIFTSIVNFVVKANILVMFGLYGAFKSIKRKERKFSILYVLLLSGIVTAILYSWINYRHFMYLIPILAIFAGVGLKGLKSDDLAVCVLVLSLFASLTYWHKTTSYDTYTRDLGNMIFGAVSQGSYMYSDQPMLAFMSKTKMSDTASLWNGMGRLRGLSVDDVEKDIDRTNPMMVLIVVSTPDNMEEPRIISTFGKEGSDKLIEFLDKKYPKKDYYRRDYQLMRIWKYD